MNVVMPCFLFCFAAVEVPIGTEFHYAGSLNRVTQNGPAEVKSFSLTAVALANNEGNPNLVFHLEERGGGSWGWPERFGILPLDGRINSKSSPVRVLFTHENQQYPVAVQSPVFEFRDKLAPQAS